MGAWGACDPVSVLLLSAGAGTGGADPEGCSLHEDSQPARNNSNSCCSSSSTAASVVVVVAGAAQQQHQ